LNGIGKIYDAENPEVCETYPLVPPPPPPRTCATDFFDVS
jgi:hypothetical protein